MSLKLLTEDETSVCLSPLIGRRVDDQAVERFRFP